MMQKALAGGYNSKIPVGYMIDNNDISVSEQSKIVQFILFLI